MLLGLNSYMMMKYSSSTAVLVKRFKLDFGLGLGAGPLIIFIFDTLVNLPI